jgi:Cu(I)/Ag(I) efflux system membrane protein CusA/SilA
MINKIIEVCLKNRFLVIAAFLLIVFWGYNSMKHTPVDAIPDIGATQTGPAGVPKMWKTRLYIL